ncbi:NAD(P)/FAD-dependent oxidoreductase [Candidatus Bathyarchaeota archaeon]|nr:NAD(P)/FAD-dependent oxidoreductase [Candidatus Bathyarchaeota archaeon]
MKAEAIVVGGGPAGLIAARELASRGVEVKAYEEHTVIGEPNHCAGILSVEGLARLDVKPSPEFIQHEVRGGVAYSPDGTPIRITGSRTRAYIVDRAAFDRHLAGQAEDAGAELILGHRVRELLVEENRVAGVLGNDGPVDAEVVIDCEGTAGFLARSVGLGPPERGVLSGINTEVSGVEVEPGMVEVWLGEDVAPGFFAWVAPMGDDSARCGLACESSDAKVLLEKFLEKRFGETEHTIPVRWPVLKGGPVAKTYGEGLLLVGDVAGQTKPTTGGGVIFGGLCAVEAAKTVCSALKADDCSAEYLSRYETAWEELLGREFSSMLAARRFADGISDDRKDRLFGSLKSSGLEGTLERLVEEGDMDMQSGVLRSALTHPGMIGVLVSSLGRLALAELRGLFNL